MTPQMHRYISGGVGSPPSSALMASRLRDMLSEAIASFSGFMEAPTITRSSLSSELADMLRYLNGSLSEKAAVEAQRSTLVSSQVPATPARSPHAYSPPHARGHEDMGFTPPFGNHTPIWESPPLSLSCPSPFIGRRVGESIASRNKPWFIGSSSSPDPEMKHRGAQSALGEIRCDASMVSTH